MESGSRTPTPGKPGFFDHPTLEKAILDLRLSKNFLRPTYVCEFLLGRYCASTSEEEIQEGLQIVERQLRDRAVRSGEEELFKSRAKDLGSVKLIDIISARLDAKTDSYVATLPSRQAQGRQHRGPARP